MVLKIFNSLGNELQEFVPLHGKNVGLYTCGPTVYDHAHIGNFRTYVWEDILKRYLIFKGFSVKQVMNLTDIDDKTIKGSIRENTTLDEYTKKYKKSFFEDVKLLNILPAEVYPEATKHIGEMVEIIQKLLDKGIAYKGEDNSIYYSIKKFPNYGKLAGIDVTKLKDGARIKQDEYEKEGIGDFALWKAWDENDGSVFWETKLGKGRPGWHIECSAMSSKYLGETFDLHTGGVDNKFPHHENEIAQSEGANGKQFVKYWMHSEHLLVDGKKMSKSLGNFYTIKDLQTQGFNPLSIRYVLVNSNYRQQLNFSINAVQDAEKTLAGLQRTIQMLQNITKETDDNITELTNEHLENFTNAMDNDLNIPGALKFVFDFAREINKLNDDDALGKNAANQALDFLKKINSVLGILTFEEKFFELTDEQQILVDKRNTARANKDFATSDQIRDELKAQGIELVDSKDGTTTAKAI
ncbi:MAG: cysteine--tRNA ligase [archaeon]|jgi:cysteinyl-tRNA synthetase